MADYVHVGDILDGKYRVERMLGEGGMGMVVAARHVHLDELVAFKYMRSKALAFDNAVQRFLREAKALIRLKGENVARMMDVGVLTDGTPYLVMEYLDGIDLSRVMSYHGALAVPDAVDFVLQASAAMAEAHSHQIVHRDLKPSNLFLTRRRTGGALIKILDFGISKYRPETSNSALFETETFGTMGSPSYMSPEQAQSAREVDSRADIWSLGVILYYFTSGQLPFVADNSAEIFAQILSDPAPSLCERAPWMAAELEAIVMRCLAKDPAERYQTVAELAVDLMPFASEDGRRTAESALRQVVGELPLPSDIATRTDAPTQRVYVEEPSRLDVAMVLSDAAPTQIRAHLGALIRPASWRSPRPAATQVVRRRRFTPSTLIWLSACGLALVAVISIGISSEESVSPAQPAASPETRDAPEAPEAPVPTAPAPAGTQTEPAHSSAAANPPAPPADPATAPGSTTERSIPDGGVPPRSADAPPPASPPPLAPVEASTDPPADAPRDVADPDTTLEEVAPPASPASTESAKKLVKKPSRRRARPSRDRRTTDAKGSKSDKSDKGDKGEIQPEPRGPFDRID